jgi:fermentation-respiration switch protein FrsA (DUF1100 family)
MSKSRDQHWPIRTTLLQCVVAAYAAILSSGCAALGPLSPLGPLERSLIYSHSPVAEQVARDDGGGEDAWITTADGVKLHGRFYEHTNPRGVVLFCHGNAGSVAEWGAAARQFSHRHQSTVLVFDYRGYGRSGGSPSEAGILRDGRAARRWLAERTHVDEADLILLGRSLGGAVAVDLAVDGGARGLILESTFTSLPDVASQHLPWMLPHWNMTQRLNSLSKIGRYEGPLLQSHGDDDQVIPFVLGQKLHDAAPGPKRFVVIRGADHNDPQSPDWDEAVDEFLDSLPGAQPPGGRSPANRPTTVDG